MDLINLLILAISLVVSWAILSRFPSYFWPKKLIAVIYIIWHLPLVLNILLPLNYIKLKQDYDHYILNTLFWLLCLHLIVGLPTIFNWKSQSRHMKLSRAYESLIGSSNPGIIKFLWIMSITSLACYILGFLGQGYSFSFENYGDTIYQNRGIAIENIYNTRNSVSSIFTFLSGMTTGFIYLLLFLSIEKKGKKVKVLYIRFFPFLTLSLATIMLGHKSTLLPGILLFLFRIILVYRLNLRKALLISTALTILFLQLAAYQNELRSGSLFKDVPVQRIFEGLGMQTKSNHILSPVLDSNQNIYMSAAILYMYFGVNYDMLTATTMVTSPYAPLGSVTLSGIYRRWNNAFDLPPTSYVTDKLFSSIGSKYHVFPRVWGTMFLGFYIEGGYLLVFLVSLSFGILHTWLCSAVIITQDYRKTIYLVVFYVYLFMSVMYFPLSNTYYISLIIAATTCSLSRRTKKRNQHMLSNS